MLSLFNLFKIKKTQNVTEYAPNTKIRYHEDLIEELTEEHKVLLKIYEQIIQSYNVKNYKKVNLLLNQFKSTLRGHLLKENTLLYIYLKYATKGDIHTHQLIVDMQREMGKIGKTVFSFLQNWTNQADISYNDSFLAELKGIGEVLAQRIDNEEGNLYVIYNPPAHFR